MSIFFRLYLTPLLFELQTGSVYVARNLLRPCFQWVPFNL